jgi:hypothetical protein
MKSRFASALVASLLLAAPGVSQRPSPATQVDPAVLAAGRLQVLRVGAPSGAKQGTGSSAPAMPSLQRTAFLNPAAIREMLSRSGVAGAPAAAVLRVQPSEAPSLVSVQMEAAEMVGNRTEAFIGTPSAFHPFARFAHLSEHSRDRVSVQVQPGGASRYLVDCEVSGMRDFAVYSGAARLHFPNAAQQGSTGHLRFLIERFDENTITGFDIHAGMVGTWAFYGCELTPIS